MNVIDSLKWRYATKKFDDTKIIALDKIALLKEAFNLTATSYGLQPIKLVILSNKTLQHSLVPHSWDQQQVAQASHVLVFATEKTIDSNYIKNYFNRVKEVRNTPDKILNPFKDGLIDSFRNMSDTDVANWAAKQAYLAMGNMLTVCAMEEIDACPMEGFLADKYDELLELTPHNLTTALVMPIGYRSADDAFAEFKKVRKEITDAVIEL